MRKKTGVSECVMRDPRRAAITNWANSSPIRVVQELAGHSYVKTTQKYYLTIQEEGFENGETDAV